MPCHNLHERVALAFLHVLVLRFFHSFKANAVIVSSALPGEA